MREAAYTDKNPNENPDTYRNIAYGHEHAAANAYTQRDRYTHGNGHAADHIWHWRCCSLFATYPTVGKLGGKSIGLWLGMILFGYSNRWIDGF